MQACLHALPHDMPTVDDTAPVDGALPAPRQQLGLWALVLALAVLSYGTHVAGPRSIDMAANGAGILFASVDAAAAAAGPVGNTTASGDNRSQGAIAGIKRHGIVAPGR